MHLLLVNAFFRIRDRNRAEETERRGAIGQSMSPEWSVVILKNMKKFVENCGEFRWNSFWMNGLREGRNADEAVVTVFT